MLDANVVFVTRLLSSKNVHVDQDQAACEDECATHQQAYCRPVLYVAPHLQHEDNACLLPAPLVVLAVRSFTQRASPSVQACGEGRTGSGGAGRVGEGQGRWVG